jgi:hypothetical protein
MRWDPHAVWPRSVIFIGAVTGVFRWSNAGAGGSTIVWVRLESDSHLVEELFELPLRLAVGRNFKVAQHWRWRRSSQWFAWGSSPRLWWCSVLLCALFVCVACVVVVFVLTCDVKLLLLLLKWQSNAPAIFSKKTNDACTKKCFLLLLHSYSCS